MKIAIIGSGPLALFAAKHFDDLGAHVVVYQRSPLGGNLRLLQTSMPHFKIVFNKQITTLADFYNKEFVGLVENAESKGLTRQGDVLRVHKRFLHPEEKLSGKSRMHDLFRVIFSLNPKETILKQLEENPEMFKQLGSEVVESLHLPVESFEDFDAVIEATGLGSPALPMGAGGDLALNENNLKNSGMLFYQNEIFTKLGLEGKKTLVLVGESEQSQVVLQFLKNWLLSSVDHSLHWITYKIEKNVNSAQHQELLDLLNVEFEKSKITFEKKMHEWRDLEDYVKVKIPKPAEPLPKVRIHQGYDVTSVDRLLDREGIFATIERPVFRSEDGEEDLKTLAADALLIVRGNVSHNLSSTIAPNEPGYYSLRANDLDIGLIQINEIETSLMTFFKKA